MFIVEPVLVNEVLSYKALLENNGLFISFHMWSIIELLNTLSSHTHKHTHRNSLKSLLKMMGMCPDANCPKIVKVTWV